MPETLAALHAELTERIGEAQGDRYDDPAAFDDVVARVLAFQRGAIGAVDAYLGDEARGGDPWWRHAVPTALFKRRLLVAGPEDALACVFASSGTTDPERRSRSGFSEAGLGLMAVAIESAARTMLFPDAVPTRVLVLAPPPELAPAIIMAWGMRHLVRTWGLPGSRFLVGEAGLDPGDVVAALREAIAADEPVTLIGASFGLVHLLDGFEAAGLTLSLPDGSRVMHAGGFKGRSRVVSPEALNAAIGARLGVSPGWVVDLLGMTELASQLYEDGVRATVAGRPPRPGKQGPPWTRTVVVDPGTLEPVRDGEAGLLVHLDLANVERPAAVRTQDVGRFVVTDAGRGFELLGRAPGSDSRGCSLSLEDLLQ